MLEHLPQFFGIGGSCGEHHVWPWLAASGGALAASFGAWKVRVWRWLKRGE